MHSIASRAAAVKPPLLSRDAGLLPDVLDDVGEDRVEGARVMPADLRADLLDRRYAVQHVLDAEAVDAVVGDELDGGARVRQRDDLLRKVEDADAVGGADVVDLAG